MIVAHCRETTVSLASRSGGDRAQPQGHLRASRRTPLRLGYAGTSSEVRLPRPGLGDLLVPLFMAERHSVHALRATSGQLGIHVAEILCCAR